MQQNNELNPPDDVWVDYVLPWVEGRCVPEMRMRLDGDRWIKEYRYPKPDTGEYDETDTLSEV